MSRTESSAPTKVTAKEVFFSKIKLEDRIFGTSFTKSSDSIFTIERVGYTAERRGWSRWNRLRTKPRQQTFWKQKTARNADRDYSEMYESYENNWEYEDRWMWRPEQEEEEEEEEDPLHVLCDAKFLFDLLFKQYEGKKRRRHECVFNLLRYISSEGYSVSFAYCAEELRKLAIWTGQSAPQLENKLWYKHNVSLLSKVAAPDRDLLNNAFEEYCKGSNKSESWKRENRSAFITCAYYYTLEEASDSWTVILCSNYRLFHDIQKNIKLFKHLLKGTSLDDETPPAPPVDSSSEDDSESDEEPPTDTFGNLPGKVEKEDTLPEQQYNPAPVIATLGDLISMVSSTDLEISGKCYICSGINHKPTCCTSVAKNKMSCTICGGFGHSNLNCPASVKCSTCFNTGHDTAHCGQTKDKQKDLKRQKLDQEKESLQQEQAMLIESLKSVYNVDDEELRAILSDNSGKPKFQAQQKAIPITIPMLEWHGTHTKFD